MSFFFAPVLLLPARIQTAHDHKKKKLKPVEKVKYRLRTVPEEEEE